MLQDEQFFWNNGQWAASDPWQPIGQVVFKELLNRWYEGATPEFKKYSLIFANLEYVFMKYQ